MKKEENSCSCSCQKCVRLCICNPGWFTPKEAQAAIRAGLGNRLMCDWLEPSSEAGNEERVYVLAPAAIHREGRMAPEFSFQSRILGTARKGRCTFLVLENAKCAIHDSGFKPLQCREAFGCWENKKWPDNFAIARLWNTEQGRSVCKEWRASL